MIFRRFVPLAAAVLVIAGCGGQSPPPASHPAAATVPPVSCRQQYETWRHGPAGVSLSGLTGKLRAVRAAGKTQDVAGLRSAMQALLPAAVALAAHPVPHCADPAGLYAEFVDHLYTAGGRARSAKGLSGLRRAMASLTGLPKIEHRLNAELSRAVGPAASKV
jgi:hypothetical protein